MKVLILGCGPAGLMAAHAVAQNGHEPIVFSRFRKSPMRGAQYLHKPIPGLPKDEFKIAYTLLGTEEGYREKVYGSRRSPIRVSVEALQGVSPAWDIRTAYDALWDRYRGVVSDRDINRIEIGRITRQCKPDIIISTIPAKLLCGELVPHQFTSTSVWISEEADYLPDRDNLVVCSGLPEHSWYRQSRVHGWENTEWPAGWSPYMRGHTEAVQIVKPISTSCTCFPSIHRMGRYGRWEKGVLSHSAYDETIELIRRFQ